MKKLLLILLLITNLFSWDYKLLSALKAFENNDATLKQKAIILQNNSIINQMRIKGEISDSIYQKTQQYYSDFVQKLGAKVCKKNGATMVVQKRDLSKAYDAGTDSDFITNATSVEQIKAIQKDFNKEFEIHLKKSGLEIAKSREWTAVNDIDFMVDPNGVSKTTFKEISKIQNDAYSRADAARYEIKTRNGEQPTMNEIIAYKDEMSDFIDKKKQKSIELSEELIKMKKDPNFDKKWTRTWKLRQQKEAKLQQINAQNSKYQDRSIDANKKLAEILNTEISSSHLPSKAKIRAPGMKVSVKQREINSATLNSMNQHLSSQSKMNEALLLSIQATEEPQNSVKIKQRIENLTKEFTPSQKGEFIERIKNTKGVSENVVKSVNSSIKIQNVQSQKPLHVKSSKLAKVGNAFGLIGDLISIDSQLEKASRGEHLLVNFNKDDSSSVKILKGTSVALLELAPIPIMDTLERYDSSDKKAKKMILNAIKRGDNVDPAFLTAMVFSDVALQSVNSMVIDPLLKGKDLVKEGISTSTTLIANYQNEKILQEDDKKNRERFDQFIKRAQKIKLDGINTKVRTKEGLIYSVLDNIGIGDRVYFYVTKNNNWMDYYSTSWEIRKENEVIKKYPLISAGNKNSNRLVFTNDFSNGNYEIIFRIFNEESKQMDFVSTEMIVNQKFDISKITVLDSSRNVILNKRFEKDKKYIFNVNPIGNWDSSYIIEWFLDGDRIKSDKANSLSSRYVNINFDDFVETGSHQVSIRAILDGKIVSHSSIGFYVKDNNQNKISTIEKLKQRMKREKNKESAIQNRNSKLDIVFEEGTKKLAIIDEYKRQEEEALARAERIEKDIQRMEAEDAKFWRDFIKDASFVAGVVNKEVKKYNKKIYKNRSKKNYKDNKIIDDLSKKEIGINLNLNNDVKRFHREKSQKVYNKNENNHFINKREWAIMTIVMGDNGVRVKNCYILTRDTPPKDKVRLGPKTTTCKNGNNRYKWYTMAYELADFDSNGKKLSNTFCNNIQNQKKGISHYVKHLISYGGSEACRGFSNISSLITEN